MAARLKPRTTRRIETEYAADGPAYLVGLPTQTVERDDAGGVRVRTLLASRTGVAPDGRRVAYLVQDGGSDWRTWHIMDT